MKPVPIRILPWLLLGSLATLAGGMVLGPEAPLLAFGIACMGLAARHSTSGIESGEQDTYGAVLSLAGAAVVLGMVLGSPLVAIVLMLEILAASGRVPSKQIVASLIPAMLAAGVGGMVFTGLADWSGISPPTLALPELASYPAIQWIDLTLAPIVGIAAALIVLTTRAASTKLAPHTHKSPVRSTFLIGIVTGVAAVSYRALTDRPINDILFSGQTALPDIIEIGTVWILLALIVAKGAAYALALIGQLEGGQIFPALALSGAVGTTVALLIDQSSMTAMVVIAIAAGTTAIQRLPIFGVVFALLLVGGQNAFDLAPLAIVGGVVGFLAASAYGNRLKIQTTAQ